jgi:hypothetical protein
MHVNPVILILTVILIIVFVVLQRKKKQAQAALKPKTGPAASASRPPKPQKPPEEVYADLRRKAFATDPMSLGLNVQEDEPYGALMELGLPSSVVTLVCFGNGDASLYYQSGGGMTGGGGHENVRRAAQKFVGLSQKAIPLMSPADGQPLPEPEGVRFYALTPKGSLTTQTHREDLADPNSELGALFYSGQEVVTQMRQIQAQRAVAG